MLDSILIKNQLLRSEAILIHSFHIYTFISFHGKTLTYYSPWMVMPHDLLN